MKKFLLPLLLMILTVSGCSDVKSIDNIGHKEIYVIGIDDEYAPMGFRDEAGDIIGFDVDLAKEVARRMGVEFEFRPIVWNKKVEELNSGRIDLIWNGLDITPDRQENILYSKPYMDNRQILLVKADSNLEIYSKYDLAGKIVGTQAGSNSENYIEYDEELKNSLKEFRTFGSFKTAFKDLESGEIDVLIVDEIVGRYEMNKLPKKFKALEVTIGPVTEIGIGFRMTDLALRDEIQNVFNDMVRDGTAKEISEKWFQADLIKTKIQ